MEKPMEFTKPSEPREGETHEQWLARSLREAFVMGHGLRIDGQIDLSPEHVKRMVAPAVSDSALFAVLTTADQMRSSIINTLFGALVCLHPEQFGQPQPQAAPAQAAEESAQPEGAADETPNPTESDEKVVPPSTLTH